MADDYREKAVEEAIKGIFQTYDPKHTVAEAVAENVVQQITISQQLPGSSQVPMDLLEPYKFYRWAAGLYFRLLLSDLGRLEGDFQDHTACNGRWTKTSSVP